MRACLSVRGAFRPLHCLFLPCVQEREAERRARRSAGGWESGLRHSLSQELSFTALRKPKHLEALNESSYLCWLL